MSSLYLKHINPNAPNPNANSTHNPTFIPNPKPLRGSQGQVLRAAFPRENLTLNLTDKTMARATPSNSETTNSYTPLSHGNIQVNGCPRRAARRVLEKWASFRAMHTYVRAIRWIPRLPDLHHIISVPPHLACNATRKYGVQVRCSCTRLRRPPLVWSKEGPLGLRSAVVGSISQQHMFYDRANRLILRSSATPVVKFLSSVEQ